MWQLVMAAMMGIVSLFPPPPPLSLLVSTLGQFPVLGRSKS